DPGRGGETTVGQTCKEVEGLTPGGAGEEQNGSRQHKTGASDHCVPPLVDGFGDGSSIGCFFAGFRECARSIGFWAGFKPRGDLPRPLRAPRASRSASITGTAPRSGSPRYVMRFRPSLTSIAQDEPDEHSTGRPPVGGGSPRMRSSTSVSAPEVHGECY